MPTIFSASHKETTKHEKSKPITSKSVSKQIIDNDRRTKVHPLTCFAINPEGIKFETQQDDEDIILFLRQHIIVNLPWLTLTIILLIAPFGLFPLFLNYLILPFALPQNYMIVGTMFWYVAAFGYALTNFIRWYFNIYIVTNERVVDIDFIHLLYKEFSEARLTSIQDMSYKESGAHAVIFNMGDVFIQTAANTPRFEFLGVPKPERVVQTISELVEKRKKEGGV